MLRPLDEIISQVWREGNMPMTSRQSPPRRTPESAQLTGDILGSGVRASEMSSSKITAAVYGRNGVGKTTFACQGEGPTALISVEPAPTGGARSVMNRDDIQVFQVAARPLVDPKTGQLEALWGSAKIVAIASALAGRFAAGQEPFRKVVVDSLTSWNEIILCEILKLDYNNMPAILGLGEVSGDQYKERSSTLIRYLRPIFDLPCDVWVIAGERDHNPPKEKTTTRSGKDYVRPTQSPLMREAHPMAQEGSFFSLGVSDAQAKWVQDASDFVMQLYEDEELREERSPDVACADGSIIPGVVQQIATGRRVRRLRCVYHPNYAARCRTPDYRSVPDYIEAPTPEERYQAFLDMVSGKRSKYGHYLD